MEVKIRNYLKEKLSNKNKTLGCWTSLDNEITSELLALVGFDFLLIDHEHGYGDVSGITLDNYNLLKKLIAQH